MVCWGASWGVGCNWGGGLGYQGRVRYMVWRGTSGLERYLLEPAPSCAHRGCKCLSLGWGEAPYGSAAVAFLYVAGANMLLAWNAEVAQVGACSFGFIIHAVFEIQCSFVP